MKSPNLHVFYEDEHIIVCQKPARIATESSKIGAPDMVSLLKNHIYQTTGKAPYLAVIHRLDQPVSGILVFAKTKKAAKELNRQLVDHTFGKFYLALVSGAPAASEGTLENYLVKESRTNTSKICSSDTNGAKLARLHYKLADGNTSAFFSKQEQEARSHGLSPTLLEIRLDTGRHHQIRVQLAGIGCPIVGDTKYNPGASDIHNWQDICLCAYRLTFRHPVTKRPMQFELCASSAEAAL